MNKRDTNIYRRTALLALLLSTLPTLVINLNYLIAASDGAVPWCVPYWDSCTSISATGRQGLAFYFFKLTMLPLAVVYWVYWNSTYHALDAAGYLRRTIWTLGRIAVIALVAYVLALGLAGDALQLTRRIGIILFFTLTYLCQLLLVYRQIALGLKAPTQRWQLRLLLTVLLVGLLTLILDVGMDNYDSIEDAFEWLIALLLHINFLLAALTWRYLDKHSV